MHHNNFAVIWDMDGVIVDSGDLHFESWRIALAQYSVIFSREKFDATFGMNNESILKLLLEDRFTLPLFQAISDSKESIYRDMLPGRIELLPGVLNLLQSIHEAGISQAVASSAPMANINAIVDGLGLRKYFEVIVSAFDIPGKPDPTVFLTAAERLNATPSNCMVIEDAIAGVEAANRAGMKCIAVQTTNPAEKLTKANLIVPTLEDISLNTILKMLTQN